MLGIGPLGLFGALGPAIQAHELLDMLRGAVQSDIEEVDLILGRGDAGQRPDLGVAELALRQRFGEQRQLGQCPGDADLLPRGMGIDAAGPAQPVGARQRPLGGPDLAAVELGDEGEESVGGGVNVGGESGDGSSERVVVHGGEIVLEDRLGSLHETINPVVIHHLGIIYLMFNFNNGMARRSHLDAGEFAKVCECAKRFNRRSTAWEISAKLCRIGRSPR